jgi:hypothetical protein
VQAGAVGVGREPVAEVRRVISCTAHNSSSSSSSVQSTA